MDQTIRYPEPMVDINDYSPQLIVKWAAWQLTRTTLKNFKKRIVDAEANPAESEKNTGIPENKINDFKEQFEQMKEHSKTKKAEYVLERESLRSGNSWAKEAKKHLKKVEKTLEQMAKDEAAKKEGQAQA